MPTLKNCLEPISCPTCGHPVYRVSARQQPSNHAQTLLFDKRDWPWKTHYCNAMIPGVWDFSLQNLTRELQDTRNFPEPFILVTIFCAKTIPRGWRVVAFKTPAEERLCYSFEGDVEPTPGEIVVSCGEADGRKLLVYSQGTNHTLSHCGAGNLGVLYFDVDWTTHFPWHP